jgi:hypothetical protein
VGRLFCFYVSLLFKRIGCLQKKTTSQQSYQFLQKTKPGPLEPGFTREQK